MKVYHQIFLMRDIEIVFFLEEVKMNNITISKESFLAQDVLRKESVQTIYNSLQYKAKDKTEKKLLAYVQYGKQTKPPPIVIEGKRNILRVLPRKSKRLNCVSIELRSLF